MIINTNVKLSNGPTFQIFPSMVESGRYDLFVTERSNRVVLNMTEYSIQALEKALKDRVR
jgi:hypothetical protein